MQEHIYNYVEYTLIRNSKAILTHCKICVVFFYKKHAIARGKYR